MKSQNEIILPAEWYPQSGVLITWPHQDSDWAPMLDEVEKTFVEIALAIIEREKLVVVSVDPVRTLEKLKIDSHPNLLVIKADSNDTWARDHGPISVFNNGKPVILDFTFNGWGMKFASNHDNQIVSALYNAGVFRDEVELQNKQNFVLEGGSIESDGLGTLMTTEECLLSPNRNSYLSRTEIENYLIELFGLKRVIWIRNGYLEGDDTDSHIDTLARFCSENTIAYVQCDDVEDPHFQELRKMEQQILSLRMLDGKPYQFVPLPMADAVWFDGERLPATYANFLIINGAVLLPTYGSPKDDLAIKQMKMAFPNHDIIGINCISLIKQHGSLHCVTMQIPEKMLNF